MVKLCEESMGNQAMCKCNEFCCEATEIHTDQHSAFAIVEQEPLFEPTFKNETEAENAEVLVFKMEGRTETYSSMEVPKTEGTSATRTSTEDPTENNTTSSACPKLEAVAEIDDPSAAGPTRAVAEKSFSPPWGGLGPQLEVEFIAQMEQHSVLGVQMIKERKVVTFMKRPLGMTFENKTPVVIHKIVPGGHAQELGIQVGWEFSKIDGKDVQRMPWKSLVDFFHEKARRLPMIAQ